MHTKGGIIVINLTQSETMTLMNKYHIGTYLSLIQSPLQLINNKLKTFISEMRRNENIKIWYSFLDKGLKK